MNPEKTGVLIPAAGASGRMKRPKAFLPFDEKISFLEKIINTYKNWGCGEIVVVINPEMSELLNSLNKISRTIRITINHHPEFERFYSVKLGLRLVVESDYCFIQNIDNPFITDNILDCLYKERNPYVYVSPVFKGKGGHPILINRNNMEYIKNYPSSDANLKEVLRELSVKEVNLKDDTVLININDPRDYERYSGNKDTGGTGLL